MSSSRHRVLVVDDDEALRHLAGEILLLEGYAITLAANGKQALARVAEYGHPDAILLDLQMPLLDGAGFAAAYRALPGDEHAPIIVCSAARDGWQQADTLGAAACVAKPYSVQSLTSVLARVLAARVAA